MGGFSDFWMGKPEKTQTFSSINPQQQQLLQSLLSQLGGPLSQAFGNISGILSNDPQQMAAFERPALRQFQEEILPNLAEGFGGLGAGSSSGAQQTFARAGERLSENLQAQRSSLQQGAVQNLMGILGQGLQGTQQNVIRPGTQGFLGGLAPGIGQGGILGLLKYLKVI
jgi:hypothetical protein